MTNHVNLTNLNTLASMPSDIGLDELVGDDALDVDVPAGAGAIRIEPAPSWLSSNATALQLATGTGGKLYKLTINGHTEYTNREGIRKAIEELRGNATGAPESDPPPKTFAELREHCFVWDNDPGTLKQAHDSAGLNPPPECRVPHGWEDLVDPSPETLNTPYRAKGEVIEVKDRAPPESPLAMARRLGLANFPTMDQFEQNLLAKQQGHDCQNWSIERWHQYIEGPPPAGLSEQEKLEWQKSVSAWQDYVVNAYNSAWDAAEGHLLNNYADIENAAKMGKNVAGFTLAVTFPAALPRFAALAAAYDTGVKTVEAIRGRNSGVAPLDVVAGNWNDHHELSKSERLLAGAYAVVGWATLGLAVVKARKELPGGTTPPETPTGRSARAGDTVATPSTAPVRYKSSESFTYDGREIRIVETPSGPQAFYKRTGTGDIANGGSPPFGAQEGDWVPFEGLMAEQRSGGATFVKPPSVRDFDPSIPLTLYRWETEEAFQAGAWIKDNPLPGNAVDVGTDWARVQLWLERAGVKVAVPIAE